MTAAELAELRRSLRRPEPELTDDELADTVERALRSHRRGREPGPGELVAISQIRRGGAR